MSDALNNVMRLIHTPDAAPEKITPSPTGDLSHLDAALEMVNRAAQAMDAMEEHAQVVEAKAQELAAQARYDVCAAKQQVASMQQRLSESETRAEELDIRLAEAEERARTAYDWLARLQEAINVAFATRQTPASAPRAREIPVAEAVG
jgi:hypothetical protein